MAKIKSSHTGRISNIVPALTARKQFGQILKRVRLNKERLVVGKRGEPQAVIMSVEEHLRIFRKPNPELHKVRKAAKAKGLDRMTMREINREIKQYRRERRARNA